MSVKKFYEENGYVVINNLIDKRLIDKFINVFKKDIIKNKQLKLPLMDKQTYSKPKIIDNKLQNPISNPHCIKYINKSVKEFNELSLKIMLSNKIYNILKILHKETSFNLVMSMFFDQNAGTPAHQDCYYLDSLPVGNLTAAWIALEDIDKKAGQFFVIPKSNNRNIILNKKEISDPSLYEKKVEKIILKEKMKVTTPIMKKGSVLFWNSGTIHGSLKTLDKSYSRKSITCHFIPKSLMFLRNRYSNEIREIKGFKYKNFYCRIIRNQKSKPKNYIIRKVSTFNKQQFA